MNTSASSSRAIPVGGVCPVDTALSVIRGRWKGTILWLLLDQQLRTSQLRRSIPGISERMLIRHLHELVDDEILARHDAHVVPPHVTYSVTDYGRTLTPIVAQLRSWGEKHAASLLVSG